MLIRYVVFVVQVRGSESLCRAEVVVAKLLLYYNYNLINSSNSMFIA
jgi:hypothetical protein